MTLIRLCNSQRMKIRGKATYFSYIIQGVKNIECARVGVGYTCESRGDEEK